MKAIVLSSGGIDSTTTMAIAQNQGYDLNSLTFNYGQRHSIEIDYAKQIGVYFNVSNHLILNIDLNKIGGSALTADMNVPKCRISNKSNTDIPITYVPARNIIFLSFAVSWGEVIGAYDIFIGANAIDYSGYPDCRPEFINAFENMVNIGTKSGLEGKKIKIHAPLISLTKGEIIKKGIDLGIDFKMTLSCYDPLEYGRPCRQCDSCKIRAKGFTEAGVNDPLCSE